MELIVIKQPRVVPRRTFYTLIKRGLDLVLCLVTLPFTLPVMAACAIAIRLNDPGPILFVQDRIGRGGRRFKIYKFRTLRTNLDEGHISGYMKKYVRGELEHTEGEDKVFKPVQGEQIFRVGQFLRKTSLDELPQIWNVLRGEMSIVGPRPNVIWEVDEYRPWHHERLEVLPGITGLAQVRGRSCIDFNSLVRHDVEYIEKRCFWLDMKILWWSAAAIMRGKGAS